VSNNWVTKLATILDTQDSYVGLLFSKKGVAKTGRGVQIRQLQQLLAVRPHPRVIVCFDRDDLFEVAAGKNFLRLIVERYAQVTAGIAHLTAIIG
jgi:hypothetical protein